MAQLDTLACTETQIFLNNKKIELIERMIAVGKIISDYDFKTDIEPFLAAIDEKAKLRIQSDYIDQLLNDQKLCA